MDGVAITTDRLAAGMWRDEYIEDFIRLNADARVMRYFLRPLSRRESLAFLERIRRELDECGYGLFAVSRLADGEFIGSVGLHRFDFDADFAPGIEICWRLLPEWWGYGYATEMAAACLDYARETLGFPEVYSFTSLTNMASRRVMEKIGMKRAGEFDHPLVPRGDALRRHVLYKTEW